MKKKEKAKPLIHEALPLEVLEYILLNLVPTKNHEKELQQKESDNGNVNDEEQKDMEKEKEETASPKGEEETVTWSWHEYERKAAIAVCRMVCKEWRNICTYGRGSPFLGVEEAIQEEESYQTGDYALIKTRSNFYSLNVCGDPSRFFSFHHVESGARTKYLSIWTTNPNGQKRIEEANVIDVAESERVKRRKGMREAEEKKKTQEHIALTATEKKEATQEREEGLPGDKERKQRESEASKDKKSKKEKNKKKKSQSSKEKKRRKTKKEKKKKEKLKEAKVKHQEGTESIANTEDKQTNNNNTKEEAAEKEVKVIKFPKQDIEKERLRLVTLPLGPSPRYKPLIHAYWPSAKVLCYASPGLNRDEKSFVICRELNSNECIVIKKFRPLVSDLQPDKMIACAAGRSLFALCNREGGSPYPHYLVRWTNPTEAPELVYNDKSGPWFQRLATDGKRIIVAWNPSAMLILNAKTGKPVSIHKLEITFRERHLCVFHDNILLIDARPKSSEPQYCYIFTLSGEFVHREQCPAEGWISQMLVWHGLLVLTLEEGEKNVMPTTRTSAASVKQIRGALSTRVLFFDRNRKAMPQLETRVRDKGGRGCKGLQTWYDGSLAVRLKAKRIVLLSKPKTFPYNNGHK